MSSESASVSDNTGKDLRTYQNFLHSVRPVLRLNRVLGLMPDFKTTTKSYHVKPLQYQKWSLISVIVCSAILFALNLWLYLDYKLDALTWWYIRVRFAVPILITITCEQKRSLIMASLEKTQEIRLKKIPKIKELQIMGFLEIILLFATSASRAFVAQDTTIRVCVSSAIDFFPFISSTGILIQFSCQVLCLNEALRDLNEEISMLMKENGEKWDLRPIMSGQTQLQLLCSVLNEAYGLSLLWASAGVALEATATFFIPPSNEKEPLAKRVFGVSWGPLYGASVVISAGLCQTTKNRIRKTRALNNRIKACLESSSSIQSRTFSEIYEWDVQLRHQTMRFSACGFFDLNAELLLKVTTTVFSSIVILYQLRIQSSKLT